MAENVSLPEKDLTLSTICNELSTVSHKWMQIGLQLGIPYSILKQFEKSDYPFMEAMNHWLKGNVIKSGVSISWKSIIAVLESGAVSEAGLAKELSKRYCKDIKEDKGKQLTLFVPPNEEEKSDIMMDLEYVLENNLHDIMTKFACYVDSLRVAIEEKKVSPEELRSFLLSVPAFNDSYSITTLSAKKSKLNECDTIIKIFDFVKTEYASFLNYEIFQTVVAKYKITDNQEVFKYQEHLQAYIQKHKISEFIKINPLLSKHIKEEDSAELILKCDINNTCRLGNVVELKKFIAKLLKLNPSAIRLIDIKDGCVVVTFAIPSFVADVIFTADTEFDVNEVRAESILWLECNGYNFDFEVSQSKIERTKELARETTCLVCYSPYADPRILPCCGHAICLPCLNQLMRHNRQTQRVFSCPICGRFLTYAKYDTFVAADHITQLQEELYTLTHVKGRMVDYYCETCCTIVSHDHEQHRSHSCNPLHEVIQKYDEEIQRSLKPLVEHLTTTVEALVQVDTRCHEVVEKKESVEDDIKFSIKQSHERLDLRKDELILQVNKLAQEKLNCLEQQKKLLTTIKKELSSTLDSIKETPKVHDNKEVLFMKLNTMQRVKETVTMIHPDRLMPNIEANDISFVPSKDSSVDCHNFGRVLTSELPDASKCYAIGKGVEIADLGQKSSVTLQILNFMNEPIKDFMEDSISCELVSEINSERIIGGVKKRGRSQCEVLYQPMTKGRHQLSIKIQGHHIRGSPFPVISRSPVEKLGLPILTFENLKEPWGVEISQIGELVVTELDEHCVSVLSPTGEKLRSFGSHGSGLGNFKYPSGLAIDPTGDIYVADNGNCRVQKFTSQGEFLTAKSTKSCPTGIAYNHSNDKVYVMTLSGSIEILNSELEYFSHFENSREKIEDPGHIACDSKGNVYVADRENHRIQVFTSEGMFLRMVGKHGTGKGQLNRPHGVAIDSSDRVWVSDYWNHRVSVFTSEGQFIVSFGKRGTNPGEFEHPRGLTIARDGIVYVCDNKNDCIQLF